MRLLVVLSLFLLSSIAAQAQTLTCVVPAPDGGRCLIPGTGNAPVGTVIGTVTSSGTMFQMLDPLGRYQLQGNNLVTTVVLPGGQRVPISLGPCAYAYSNNGGIGNAPPPAVYAPPWDVTQSGLSLPQLATVPCATSQIGGSQVLTIGGSASQAVNKTIQFSTNGVNWTPQTLTPLAGTVGVWDLTGGTATLPAQENWVYVQFLVATKTAQGWAYGGCSTPTLSLSTCVPKWSVQAFFIPQVTISSISVTPKPFQANTANVVSWPITATMSDSSTPNLTYSIAGPNTCGFSVNGSTVVLIVNTCAAGSYSDWQVVAVPANPLIPTMSVLGGTATAQGGPVVTSITPTSQTIFDNQTGAIVTLACTVSPAGACPPAGYTWQESGQPSFVSLNATTGELDVAGTLTDGTVNWTISVAPSNATVIGFSPTQIFVPDGTGANVVLQQEACQMSDSSQCSGRSWVLSNAPSWLVMSTSGLVSTGPTVPSPLPDGTYSPQITVQ